MAMKPHYINQILPVEKVKEFALAEDFLGRVDEMIERVQAVHGVTRLSAQQSLFMARAHFLHAEHDVRALQQGEDDVVVGDLSRRWSEYRELNILTVGDVVPMPDGKLYLKKNGEEVFV